VGFPIVFAVQFLSVHPKKLAYTKNGNILQVAIFIAKVKMQVLELELHICHLFFFNPFNFAHFIQFLPKGSPKNLVEADIQPHFGAWRPRAVTS